MEKTAATYIHNIYPAVALYRAELIRVKAYFYRSKQLLKNVYLVRPRFFVVYEYGHVVEHARKALGTE